jgi:hypothetical protein
MHGQTMCETDQDKHDIITTAGICQFHDTSASRLLFHVTRTHREGCHGIVRAAMQVKLYAL